MSNFLVSDYIFQGIRLTLNSLDIIVAFQTQPKSIALFIPPHKHGDNTCPYCLFLTHMHTLPDSSVRENLSVMSTQIWPQGTKRSVRQDGLLDTMFCFLSSACRHSAWPNSVPSPLLQVCYDIAVMLCFYPLWSLFRQRWRCTAEEGKPEWYRQVATSSALKHIKRNFRSERAWGTLLCVKMCECYRDVVASKHT